MKKERRMPIKKTDYGICPETPLMVDTATLQSYLSCGRGSAIKIGEQACAKVCIGKRVLWNLNKIRLFVNEIAE